LSHGVIVEGANASIVFGSVTGHNFAGIHVANAGSARIGILNNNAYGPILISDNKGPGVHVALGASAYIGGSTIQGNGTSPTINNFGRYGIGIHQASATLAGNNVIKDNGEAGVFVRAGSVFIGDASFGQPTTNTISGNGISGPTTGGLFAYQNGIIFAHDATVSGNVGSAAQAFESSVIELRAASSVAASTGNTGASINFGSRLRVRDTASISGNQADGVQVGDVSAVNVSAGTIQGTGAGSVGVRCTNTSPLPLSASTLTGNLSGVTHAGCNVFPTTP
jgi:hypothetical protein